MTKVGLWVMAAALLALAGCKSSNGDFCDAEHPCTDPTRPFCDVAGTYPASDGVAKTCIPDPGGGGDCSGDGDCADPAFPACELEQCRECRDAAGCTASAPVCTDYACGACAAPADCAAYPDTPVCGAAGACVECGEDVDCAGTTPICGATGTCEACTGHAQCDSGICDVGTGACVAEGSIAYVTTAGVATTGCTIAAPCGAIQAAIDLERAYVLVGAGEYLQNPAVSGTTVTIVGPGAIVSASLPNAPALLVGDGSNVTVEGLTLRDGHGGADGDGIRCVRVGATPFLNVVGTTITTNSGAALQSSGCDVRVSNSTIATNSGGGLTASTSSVSVRNSFFFGNGQPGPTGSAGGGIRISEPVGAVVLEWTTIAFNYASTAALYPGVRCDDVTTPLAFQGLIVWGEGTQVPSTGNCTFTHSNLAGVPAAGTNISTEPTWIDAAAGNYHLAPGSAGIDQGGTTGVPITDFDGDPRPQGAAADIGADETAP